MPNHVKCSGRPSEVSPEESQGLEFADGLSKQIIGRKMGKES